ncbi:SDR family NAD(P)-dependent oxidoreductase [Lactococcus allomyrinae]|uniref:SDR family NAD(P)-dependent oxidoreductase n=1 Tax=Lactococcus allomyrinae TaxID=2419773 RepID=A0A387BFL9_9LACT|nr:SDR family NAD(P)-dependent oxidoreductase [Lactococcus allomyrinae]AYF99709.1 SDR family NAD(P)-dependent oxidoreductase [Lactococcus allomyrinae]
MTRNILITGATGDIAQEIVKLLAQEQLILVSRSLSALTELYGYLSNVTLLTNEQVLADGISVSVDILINNAGFGVFKTLSELTDAEVTEQFVINTLFPIQLIRQVNPKLQIVNIASSAGKLPTAKSSIYAASKAALIVVSDVLRMERPELIVTTVNTGPVKTKFHKNNKTYLEKVGKNAISAEKVARKIVKSLGKTKREINLPWQLTVVSKFRVLFPTLTDFLSVKFFDFK